MKSNSAEIESIICIVVERLRAMPTESKHDALPSGTVRIHHKLITLEQLDGCLDGVQVLQVCPTAVVTPAVDDELSDRRIRLQRVSFDEPSQATKADRQLLLIATLNKAQTITAQAGALNARIATCATQHEDISELENHFAAGGQVAIWCSPTPYASVRAVAAHGVIQAVQLARIEDLQRALDEADPNVLIIDDQLWTSAAITNLARSWTRTCT